jgi:hypothetical protein
VIQVLTRVVTHIKLLQCLPPDAACPWTALCYVFVALLCAIIKSVYRTNIAHTTALSHFPACSICCAKRNQQPMCPLQYKHIKHAVNVDHTLYTLVSPPRDSALLLHQFVRAIPRTRSGNVGRLRAGHRGSRSLWKSCLHLPCGCARVRES